MLSASMAYNTYILPCHFFRIVMQSAKSSKILAIQGEMLPKSSYFNYSRISALSYTEKAKTKEK